MRILLFLITYILSGGSPDYKILKIDGDIAHVKMSKDLLTGSDQACHRFGIAVNDLINHGFSKVYVISGQDEILPTIENPIDADLALILAQGY